MLCKLKLQKVRDLKEDNLKDTILYINHIKEYGYPLELDEALDDIVKLLADTYKKEEMTDYDLSKSAYLVYNRMN